MSMKMPTAQSSSTSSSLQNNTKNSKKNVDNKIAKAAAKVAAERGSSGGSQENTRATTPDQQGQQQQQQQQAPQATGGVKTPQEQPEFIKQSLIVIEKKVRNLEKRRTKLEEYRDIQAKGTPLNDDQLAAISRYDEVCRTLELSRELEKQFIGLANDAMKQQKKQLKKEQMEREEAVREKLKESQKVLALLNSFGDETVRNDFLNELNGASKVSELELNALDEFNKIVQPANEISSRLESISNESAEHIYNLIEAKNKQIAQLSAQVVGAAFTYADLKKLFDRIFSSAYWQQRELNLASSSTAAAETPVETATTNEQQADTQQQQIDAHLSEQIGQLNMNVEQQSQQQNDVHHHSNIPLEQVYHQQNTSEDYILVSAQSDVSGGDASGQNKASRTFFSTLNPQDRNINEFLNRESNEEGINFLQDSEIQSNQAQQQHQVHEQQHQVEHHHQQQQAPHQHQQHLDNQHPQGGQGFQTYQEFGQNEHYKDSRGPRRDYNGPRNQHQNNNGGNANYPPQQQRPRYQDGGPRRGGGQNGGVIPNQQQPRSNVDRNGGGGGGYRGGNRGGMGGGQRTGGGEYRGGNYSSGPRQGGAGGQQQQRYPPRQQQPADQN